MKKFIFLAIISGFFIFPGRPNFSMNRPFSLDLAGEAEAKEKTYPPVPSGAPSSKYQPHFDQPAPPQPGSGSGDLYKPRVSKPSLPSGSLKKSGDNGAGAAEEPSTGQPKPLKEALGNAPPPPMLEAGGEIFSAIKLLEAEIKRDAAIVEGEMTPEAMDKVRARLTTDLESKNALAAKLEEKYAGKLKEAIDLIKKTAEIEKGLAASKSNSGEKRRTVQRRIEGNIPSKKEALALLKKEVGE